MQTLPFSVDKQDAILGHLIMEPKFYAQARHLVEPEWFIDSYNQNVYRYLSEFFVNFGRSPTVPELKNANKIITRKATLNSGNIAHKIIIIYSLIVTGPSLNVNSSLR